MKPKHCSVSHSTQLDREKVENKLLQNDSSCTARCSSLSQSRRSRIESTFPLFLSSLAFQQLQLYLRQMDCGPSCVPSTWRQGTQYTYTGSASLAQNVKARGGRGSICPACPLNPRHTSTCKVFKVSQFHEKRLFRLGCLGSMIHPALHGLSLPGI